MEFTSYNPIHNIKTLIENEVKNNNRRIKQNLQIHSQDLRKIKIFNEIEFLENYYEEITMTITSNKIISIDAILPKNVEIIKLINKIPNKPVFKKMPILTICKGACIKSNNPIEYLKLPDKITFIIPLLYPNSPPFLYINDIQYIHTINCCNLERIKRTIGKYINTYRYHLNCFSCATILKPNNWNKEHMFSDIFDEYRQIERLKLIIKYDIILEELSKYKELEYSITVNIMEYLINVDSHSFTTKEVVDS